MKTEHIDNGDLLGLLDQGIADMEAGRVVPYNEAMRLVAEMVEKRDAETQSCINT